MVGLTLLPLLIGGCSRPASVLPEQASSTTSVVPIGTRFDPMEAGGIRGQMTWNGRTPTIPKIQAVIRSNLQGLTIDNPHTPRIDEKTQGMAGVVVFLRGVDPQRSRPWDLPPVRVEIAQNQLRIHSDDDSPGGVPRAVGFTRVGDTVTLNVRDPGIQMVRARGAAFFTLPFPVPDQPLARRFDQPGRVELTNGAGYYWQSADLFICEHPYYAITNTDGVFHLPQVPPGEYELVAWVRDWHLADVDRDPETGLILRQHYQPPVEKSERIVVPARQETTQNMMFQESDFGTKDHPGKR